MLPDFRRDVGLSQPPALGPEAADGAPSARYNAAINWRPSVLMAATIAPSESTAIVLRLRPAIELDEDQFFEFCQLNRDLRIERTAEGDLEIMPPTGGETGIRNARLTTILTSWAIEDGSGEPFDS